MSGARLVEMAQSEDPDRQEQAVELAYSISKGAGDAARHIVYCMRTADAVWALSRSIGQRWARAKHSTDRRFHMTASQMRAIRARLWESADWWDDRASLACRVLMLEVTP